MILIACGLVREAKLLGGPGIVCVPGGGNATALEAALEAQVAGATMILSSGIAGALDPALKAGDIVIGGDAASDWLKILPGAHLGTVIGQDSIAATAAAKAALRQATGASAVDMETHVAARVAARHRLPLLVFRTISDTARETLPPAALVGMSPDGSMALGAVLRSLARRPWQLPALIRTGRNAEVAFRSLARVHDALTLW